MVDKELRGRDIRLKCKREAKEKLKDNKVVFAGACLLLFVLTLVVDSLCMLIPLVGNMVSGAVSTLFTLGFLSMSLKLVDGGTPNVSDLFNGFKINPVKSVCLFLLTMLFYLPIVLIASLVMLLPLLTVFGVSLLDNGVILSTLISLFVLIPVIIIDMILFAVSTTALNAYLFASFYMLVEGDDRSIFAILKDSRDFIKGRVLEYIVFNFSFLGWYLTVPFTLGLSLLWLMPYINISYAIYYRELSSKGVEVINTDGTVEIL